MDAKREQKLVDLLNTYDVSGVPFMQAKRELLAQGFTEAEIVYGLYSAPFDGKVNRLGGPRPTNPLQKFYEEDPDRAEKLAKALLLDVNEQEWSATAANAGAATFGPDIQSRSYYEVQTADRLGIPYFTLLAAGLVLLVITIKLNLSKQVTSQIFFVYNLAVSGIFGYKLVRTRYRLHKLRREVSQNGREDRQQK